MDNHAELVEISGTVEAVVFTNEENGYSVLRIENDDGEHMTVTGCIPYAAPGELITVGGVWTYHSTHGKQLKAEYAHRRIPTGADAIYEYLSSRVIRGIGPVTASLLVARFGDNTLQVIENQPEKLAEIKGISLQKAREISEIYKKQIGIRHLMEYLSGYGLKPVYAMRLYRFYGDSAIEIIRDNPYILCAAHIGAPFHEADAFAIELGFDADAPQRVSAAILFELAYNLGNGHCFIPDSKLVAVTCRLIDVQPDIVEECLDMLRDAGEVFCEPVANVNACYLTRLYTAESKTARRIAAMAAGKNEAPANLDKIIRRAETNANIHYSALQRKTLEIAASNQIMVLTGGPGTGKTTTVRAIIELFDSLELETALAAPTGRAAKRMSELSGGREAFTVHRLLEATLEPDGEHVAFRKNAGNLLKCDAVILDETSMIDILLLHALLEAMPPHSRLILVGDADQLPSVGPGNVFRDIIRSGVVETVCLTEIFRQSKESHIVSNAHSINAGQHPDLRENRDGFFFLRRKDNSRIAETIIELCRTRLPNNMGISPGDIQVLCPTRRFESGTQNLNKLLQMALNPASEEKKEKKFGEIVFRTGDKVMQIRNNYDTIWTNHDNTVVGNGVYNGDVGTILRIDPQEDTVTVDFDGKIAVYAADMLNELEHAYAVTVHKSQGSEYKAVVLSLGKAPQTLMNRSLLYTAVTRAKQLLIIVGDDEIFHSMIDNHKQAGRYSGLRFRLAGLCHPET